jgi:hypothetical protein
MPIPSSLGVRQMVVWVCLEKIQQSATRKNAPEKLKMRATFTVMKRQWEHLNPIFIFGSGPFKLETAMVKDNNK